MHGPRDYRLPQAQAVQPPPEGGVAPDLGEAVDLAEGVVLASVGASLVASKVEIPVDPVYLREAEEWEMGRVTALVPALPLLHVQRSLKGHVDQVLPKSEVDLVVVRLHRRPHVQVAPRKGSLNPCATNVHTDASVSPTRRSPVSAFTALKFRSDLDMQVVGKKRSARFLSNFGHESSYRAR